jgi:hypothetical protein
MSDPVREYLRDKGCAEHVVKGGFGGLVRDWESTVASIVRGYEFGLDDYLNDLDGRQLISEVMEIADPPTRLKYGERVRLVDERVRKALRPTVECLWGNSAAARHGWTAEKNWWYFSVPQTAGPELLIDLNSDRR